MFQVIVFQAYKNNSTAPIEAKYVFPLDDMAAGMLPSLCMSTILDQVHYT